MRFLFIVQGEGRGHMTQAISLISKLLEDGHEVAGVIVGTSDRREIPDFFEKGIGVELHRIESPNFVTDDENRSIRIAASIFRALLRIRVYIGSIRKIKKIERSKRPDVIVNFYDFTAGLYNLIYGHRTKFVCIAHQYLIKHTAFEFPEGRWLQRQLMKIGNAITSFRADLILALSFRELPDEPDLHVVPPLLRSKVLSLKATTGDHLLVYMLNHGYSQEIYSFHERFPEIPIECFWDKKDEPEVLEIDQTLRFYRLNEDMFLQKMASSKGYLTTAGFESVCEAMYLGKPVQMVPVEGHYEQECNAIDGKNAGAGIKSADFDLEKLINYIPKHRPNSDAFKAWSSRSGPIILQKIIDV